MVDPKSIPVGVFAFDSEGDELGQVAEVAGSGIVVEDSSGALHWVSLHAIQGITAGKLILRGRGLP